jgi:hypothetical protein
MENIATTPLPQFLPDSDLIQYVQTSIRFKKLIHEAFSRQFKEQCNRDMRFCGEPVDKRYTRLLPWILHGLCVSVVRVKTPPPPSPSPCSFGGVGVNS